MSTSYEYRPLEGTEIRLLHLYEEPLNQKYIDTTIICDIKHIPIDSPPPFVAISYVWSDPSCVIGAPPNPTIRIAEGGHEIKITQSLWRAIHTIRMWRFSARRDVAIAQQALLFFGGTEHLGWIWADAVCMNQEDSEEKIREIPRMTAIYGKAAKVFGSLGMPYSMAEEDLMTYMSDQCETLLVEFETNIGEKMLFEKGFSFKKYFGERLDSAIDGLISIVSRPWFQRVWIIQELAAASSWPVLGVGHNLIRCEALAFMAIMFERRLLTVCPPTFDVDSVRRLTTIASIRAWQMQSSKCPHSDLSIQCPAQVEVPIPRIKDGKKTHLRIARCSPRALAVMTPFTSSYQWIQGDDDISFASRINLLLFLGSRAIMRSTLEHDMIYGILGLATSSPLPLSLRLDYSTDYPRICKAYAKFIAEKTGVLWFLGFTRERRFEEYADLDSRIPTWVPDFRTSTFFDTHYPPKIPRKPGAKRQLVTFFNDGNTIHIHGSNMDYGKIIRVWRGTQRIKKWSDPRFLTRRMITRFRKRIILESARCMGVSEADATDIWLLGHEKARYVPSANFHQPHYMRSEIRVLRAVWSSLLRSKVCVKVTWQMRELLGHKLSLDASEMLFNVASQIAVRKAVMTADGTIWKSFLNHAGNALKLAMCRW